MSKKKQKLSLLKPAFIAICLVMFVGTIFFAVDTATAGAEISKLERDLGVLETKNKELAAEIIRHSSVSSMDAGAEALGFAMPEKTVYLTIEDAASAYVR